MKIYFDKMNELKKLMSELEDISDHIELLIDHCQLEGEEAEESRQAAQDAAKSEFPHLMISTIAKAELIIIKLAELQLAARKTEFDQNFELMEDRGANASGS